MTFLEALTELKKYPKAKARCKSFKNQYFFIRLQKDNLVSYLGHGIRIGEDSLPAHYLFSDEWEVHYTVHVERQITKTEIVQELVVKSSVSELLDRYDLKDPGNVLSFSIEI